MLHNLCPPSPDGNALAIFGAGASGREIAWLAQQCWGENVSISFLVDRDDLVGTESNGIPNVHFRDFVENSPRTPVLVAIGDPALREQCVQKCVAAGLGFTSLVHPRVEASHRVAVGIGTMIGAGVVLTTNISIGQHVYINIGCTVSHDAQIADFATLSPGVHISGWVNIGRSAFFGTGAVVRNGSSNRPVTIGENAIIGAGACVIRDVEANTTVVGVPATRTLP
jgi:sugar O-acyltransferase (sialic acid O-acetyltransferase NeuD family)